MNIPGSEEPIVTVEAINDGAVPVTLTDFGLRFPSDPRDKSANMRMSLAQAAKTDKRPPAKLDPGERMHAWIDAGHLMIVLRRDGFRGIVTVQGYFNDQRGNHWRKGKSLEIDLDSEPNEG